MFGKHQGLRAGADAGPITNAQQICSRSALPAYMEMVPVTDPNSIASKLGESLTQAKVDEFEEQGIKALRISVLHCNVKSYNSVSPITFQSVELQTNYDLSKLSSLVVDLANTQKYSDTTASTRQILYAVPIVLVPECGSLRLVFTFVARGCRPSAAHAVRNTPGAELANWSVKNARGDEVTFLSVGLSACPLPQPMFVRGGPEEALVQFKSMFSAYSAKHDSQYINVLASSVGKADCKNAVATTCLLHHQSVATTVVPTTSAGDDDDCEQDDLQEFAATAVRTASRRTAARTARRKAQKQQRACGVATSSSSLVPPVETSLHAQHDNRNANGPCFSSTGFPSRGHPARMLQLTQIFEQEEPQRSEEDVTLPSPKRVENANAVDASSSAGLFIDHDWLGRFLAGATSRKEPCSKKPFGLPKIEELLFGWMSAVQVVEAYSQWQTKGAKIGPQYWCYRRNENACWRLAFLKRTRRRVECRWGHCAVVECG